MQTGLRHGLSLLPLLLAGACLLLWPLLATPAPLRAATQLVAPESLPDFSDDLHWQDLEQSLRESLRFLDALHRSDLFSWPANASLQSG